MIALRRFCFSSRCLKYFLYRQGGNERATSYSRETFYRYQNAVQAGGVEALLDKNRRVPNVKNCVDELTESAVIAFAIEFPAYGQLHASNELRKKGIFVSPSGVRSIWLRHQLGCLKQRLAVLEKKSADLFNDKVLPFFEEHQVELHRMLTDRGTEYCGKPGQHDYQLYLAINAIEHTQKNKSESSSNKWYL